MSRKSAHRPRCVLNCLQRDASLREILFSSLVFPPGRGLRPRAQAHRPCACVERAEAGRTPTVRWPGPSTPSTQASPAAIGRLLPPPASGTRAARPLLQKARRRRLARPKRPLRSSAPSLAPPPAPDHCRARPRSTSGGDRSRLGKGLGQTPILGRGPEGYSPEL